MTDTVNRERGMRRPWTAEEEAYLMASVGPMKSNEIGVVLGRSGLSVRHKATKMGLKFVSRRTRPRRQINKARYETRSEDGRQILVHREVAAEKIGRLLIDGVDIVHHINVDHKDNRPENLHVCTNLEHSHAHASMFKLIKPLLEMGVIWFDENEHAYKVSSESSAYSTPFPLKASL